jgi:hypothetical protein
LFSVHSIWKKMFLQTSTKKAWAQAVGMSNWRCARSSRPPQQMWAVGGIAATKIRTANRVGQYLTLDHTELSNFRLRAGFSDGRKWDSVYQLLPTIFGRDTNTLLHFTWWCKSNLWERYYLYLSILLSCGTSLLTKLDIYHYP